MRRRPESGGETAHPARRAGVLVVQMGGGLPCCPGGGLRARPSRAGAWARLSCARGGFSRDFSKAIPFSIWEGMGLLEPRVACGE